MKEHLIELLREARDKADSIVSVSITGEIAFVAVNPASIDGYSGEVVELSGDGDRDAIAIAEALLRARREAFRICMSSVLLDTLDVIAGGNVEL